LQHLNQPNGSIFGIFRNTKPVGAARHPALKFNMPKYLSIFIAASLFILSCAKEYSYEGGPKLPINDTTAVSDTGIRNDVYVVGYIGNEPGGLNRVVYWKNATPIYITDSTGTAFSEDIFVTPSKDVYITGLIKQNGTFRACVWKNGQLNLMSVPPNSINSEARSVKVVGNDVYVAGTEVESSINGQVNKAVYWKNGQMVTLTNGDFPARAYSIAVQGSDIYVCGIEGNSQLNRSAKYWKNGTAIALTDGTKESEALDIAVNNGDVYVCGMESSSTNPGPGSNYQAKLWKNGQPTILRDPSIEAWTRGIAIENSRVYITGIEFVTNGGSYIWSDGTGNTIPPVNNERLIPFDIAVNKNTVYIAGTVSEVTNNGLTFSGYYLKGDSTVFLHRGANYVSIRAIYLR
jgi:hypothetical protein